MTGISLFRGAISNFIHSILSCKMILQKKGEQLSKVLIIARSWGFFQTSIPFQRFWGWWTWMDNSYLLIFLRSWTPTKTTDSKKITYWLRVWKFDKLVVLVLSGREPGNELNWNSLTSGIHSAQRHFLPFPNEVCLSIFKQTSQNINLGTKRKPCCFVKTDVFDNLVFLRLPL